MKTSLAKLRDRHTLLCKRFQTLSDALITCSEDLSTRGLPPAESLISDLGAARQEFATLSEEVLKLATIAQVLPLPDQVSSQPDLANLLQQIHEHCVSLEQVRKRSVSLLEQVLRLMHRDHPDFAPLRECQATAHEMLRALHEPEAELPQTAMALNESDHPFAALSMLVEQREVLEDDRWLQLQETVTHAFGRPLAVAALRGKIIVRSDGAPAGKATTLAPTKPTSPPTEEKIIDIDAAEEAVIQIEASTDKPTIQTVISIERDAETARVEEKAVDEEKGKTASQRPAYENPQPEPVKPSTNGQSATSAGPDPSFSKPSVKDAETVASATALEGALYNFHNTDSAQYIAGIILDRGRADCPAELRDLVWRLIYEDQLGLACHLARAIEQQFPALKPLLPSWVLKALALSRNVRHEVGELASRLEADFLNFNDECFEAGAHEWNHAMRFVLTAAALRPALLAPNSGASAILHSLRLKEGLNDLYNYLESIANYGDQHQALDPITLKRVKDEQEWEADLVALQREVQEWQMRAPGFDMINGQARDVWQHWLEPGGVIHALLNPIRQDHESFLAAVKEDVRRFSDEKNTEWQVNQTNRKLRKRGSSKIISNALGRICRYTREAIEFARRWIELREIIPGKTHFSQPQAEHLRRLVWDLQPKVQEELQQFEKRWQTSAIVLSGIEACRRSIKYISLLFDPDVPLSAEEPLARELLHVGLLCAPSIVLNDEWEPEAAEPLTLIQALLKVIASGEPDWAAVFAAHADERDHEATQRVIEYLKRHPEIECNLDGLRAAREKYILECRAALGRDIEGTRREVEGAVAFGLLGEKERARHAAQIDIVELALDETLRFSERHAQLRDIREELGRKRAAGIESVRQQLENSLLEPDHSAVARIRHVLNQGDVLTANEYLRNALSNLPLPDEAPPVDSFSRFFPETFREIINFLGSPNHPRIDKLAEEIRAYARGHRPRYSLGPVEMYRVTGNQALQAAEMLELWFSVKRRQSIEAAEVQKFLTVLGLNVTKSPQARPGRRAWFDVQTEALRDRDRCPAAAYGSNAGGNYRLLCVWDRPTEEDLLNDIGDTAMGPPTVVFHFGRMIEQRRRDLARVCLEKRRTLALIDDALVFYLCGERDTRLRTLFECVLPFTFLEPYTITAGLVPPEMFYGRKLERESIINPLGSCFIYGGRQLGKTALLRDVEHVFHTPEQERVALWLDLKACGIGYNRGIDDLWVVLAGEMKRLGVVPSTMPHHASVDTLLNHVADWLAVDERRRILLLLDEADRFLEIDGKPAQEAGEGKGEFVRTASLKGLMDRTNRRFKVVFAGLHNVQRTTRLGNNPLAHYGEPICVGPLLNHDDVREARALIERPLASLGYRFESPDLVTRILSQTNYYPSLIQLYCHQLLRHISNPSIVTFDVRTTPPYVITSQHVQDAYQSKELRKAIRDRLRWTLDLDPRYRVIAYAIALYSSPAGHQSAGVLDDGFTVMWIREQALTWWPQGFSEVTSEDAFQALLDEMIGLGVLRAAEGGRYALRSPNVALLIGTQEEIEAELDSCLQYEAPPTYEAFSFRTSYSSDLTHRCPLTAQQESELRSWANGITIIYGNSAAGLEELPSALAYAFGKEFFIYLDDLMDRAGFADRLETELKRRQRNGTTLLLISAACPWSEGWITDALKSLNKRTHKSAFVRIAFMADPPTTWQWLSGNNRSHLSLNSDQPTTLSLRPWDETALRYWLDDGGFTSDRAAREKICSVTGNWPLLLRRFYQCAQSDQVHWAQHLHELGKSLRDQAVINEIAAALGLNLGEPRAVLQAMAILDTAATTVELSGIVDGISEDAVRQSLRWAELLSLVRPIGGSRWQLDGLASRLLSLEGG